MNNTTANDSQLGVAAGPRPWSRWQILARLVRKKTALLGLVLCLLVVLSAIFAAFIAPYDPLKIDVVNRLQPPSGEHWFGTDELGRDLYPFDFDRSVVSF